MADPTTQRVMDAVALLNTKDAELAALREDLATLRRFRQEDAAEIARLRAENEALREGAKAACVLLDAFDALEALPSEQYPSFSLEAADGAEAWNKLAQAFNNHLLERLR